MVESRKAAMTVDDIHRAVAEGRCGWADIDAALIAIGADEGAQASLLRRDGAVPGFMAVALWRILEGLPPN